MQFRDFLVSYVWVQEAMWDLAEIPSFLLEDVLMCNKQFFCFQSTCQLFMDDDFHQERGVKDQKGAREEVMFGLNEPVIYV